MNPATYTFALLVSFKPKKSFRSHSMRVDIVEERKSRYRVKYLERHPNGDAPNTLHWVSKAKVTPDYKPPEIIFNPYKD